MENLPILSKEEFFDAIRQGVKDAILTMTESGDGFSGLIRTDEFMEAVKYGVRDAFLDMSEEKGVLYRPEHFMECVKDGVSSAVWNIATNATDMPCSDFYEMIKQGVKEGMPSEVIMRE